MFQTERFPHAHDGAYTSGILNVIGFLLNGSYKRKMRQKDTRILSKAQQIQPRWISIEFRKNGQRYVDLHFKNVPKS